MSALQLHGEHVCTIFCTYCHVIRNTQGSFIKKMQDVVYVTLSQHDIGEELEDTAIVSLK